MKTIIRILVIAILCCLTSCQEPSGPKPPIELPFAVHQAGATVSTELRIVDGRNYPLNLIFKINENDKEDRARLRKLVGGSGIIRATGEPVEPGIPIPLRLTITNIDPSGERPFLDREMLVGMLSSGSRDQFVRHIAQINFSPGLYRVSVKSLKNIPELASTKIIFAVHLRMGK
jgi:hypothetical protein